jgi:hypothetical protein
MIVSGKFPEAALCCGELESVTLNVSGVAVPSAVGVPLITPVLVFNVSPPGSVPEFNDQVYEGVPPVAVSANMYGWPTIPLGSAVVVIMSEAGEMVSSKFAVAVCGGVPESVSLNVSDRLVTVTVGVPLTTPVEGFNVKPAGSVPLTNCQV